jgi:hypothetical protein
VSWEDAKRDATQWLDRLQLRRPAKGETLDLRPYAESLPFEGKYREMVINALGRLLKARGVDAILPG